MKPPGMAESGLVLVYGLRFRPKVGISFEAVPRDFLILHYHQSAAGTYAAKFWPLDRRPRRPKNPWDESHPKRYRRRTTNGGNHDYR